MNYTRLILLIRCYMWQEHRWVIHPKLAPSFLDGLPHRVYQAVYVAGIHRQRQGVHRQSMTQEIAPSQQREENPMRHPFVGTGKAAIVGNVFVRKVDAEHRASDDRPHGYIIPDE